MPITKSAIKKQRADKAKAVVNSAVSSRMKTAMKKVETAPSKESVANFYSAVDIAVKSKILKKNTAARLKAKIVRVLKAKGGKSLFSSK